jgi:hypothetical protein
MKASKTFRRRFSQINADQKKQRSSALISGD